MSSVAFSPDGNMIASGSFDGAVKLWNADTGKCLRTLKGHSKSVNSVAFSPNSNMIVSGSSDEMIKLWDADTGKCLRTLKGHSKSVNSVAFSPNSNMIVSGSSDEKVKLWDADTGKCLRTLKGHSKGVDSVVFSPNGNTIASGSSDKNIRIWKGMWQLEACVRKDDTSLSTIEGTIYFYDVKSLKMTGSFTGRDIYSPPWRAHPTAAELLRYDQGVLPKSNCSTHPANENFGRCGDIPEEFSRLMLARTIKKYSPDPKTKQRGYGRG